MQPIVGTQAKSVNGMVKDSMSITYASSSLEVHTFELKLHFPAFILKQLRYADHHDAKVDIVQQLVLVQSSQPQNVAAFVRDVQSMGLVPCGVDIAPEHAGGCS
eukprot:GHUV01037508.1.p3 GENE.GHUV01037508.1~~GHUV01037508.1.p3  ORF type:complete len:104 (+),score=11.13 GHUV01037508.1:399-710(+)